MLILSRQSTQQHRIFQLLCRDCPSLPLPSFLTLTCHPILQVATPSRVIIFDLLALSGERTGSSGPDLVQSASNLFQNLFLARDIAKVGWSFSRSDIRMLRSSARGRTGQDRIGQDRIGQDRIGQDRIGWDTFISFALQFTLRSSYAIYGILISSRSTITLSQLHSLTLLHPLSNPLSNTIFNPLFNPLSQLYLLRRVLLRLCEDK